MATLDELTFSDICEVYLEELRSGNKVNIQSLAQRFPKYSDQIIHELPQIALLEKSLQPNGKSRIQREFASTPYELLEEIGRGASGIVFKTKVRSSGKLVALKLMKLSRDPDSALRLNREIESLGRLSHPNIVSIIDQGIVKDYVYIVMNLVDGFCMSDLLHPRPPLLASYWLSELKSDWKRLAVWGKEIASALEYIHSQNIYHRDMKPANILVDRDGKIWISDFGLAKIRNENLGASRTGIVVGTPKYMAPEQMRGVVDQRSDIYALGRTLYELACIGADESHNCHEQIDLAPITKLNPHIPEGLGYIIDRACDQVAERRFQSAHEMVVVLTRFLDGKNPCDRRRFGKRMTEEEFKASLRSRYRSAILVSVIGFAATLLLMVGLRSTFLRPAPSQELVDTTPVVAPEKFKSLASKIENADAGFVEVVGEAIKQSVVGATDDPSTKQIGEKIDRIVSHVASQGLKPGELDSIIQGYRTSSLSISDKILALSMPLGHSGLSDQEKLYGRRTLMLFSKTVVAKQISTAEAERMVAALFHGNVPKMEQMAEVRIPDRIFSSWLQLVNETFRDQFRAVAQQPVRGEHELGQILDRFLQNVH